MLWMAAHGVTEVWEIGAGKALTGMVKRIDRSLGTRTIGTADEVKTAAAALAG
jgi:[acyl-carrier-protein] S-malonyltransferase